MIRFIIFIILFLSYSLFSEISKPTEFLEQDFDVKKYEVYSDFSTFPDKMISGYSKIRIDWNNTDSDRTFYFHSNGFIIDSVLYDGEKFPGIIEYEDYYSIVPKDDTESRSSDIIIYFHGEMKSEGGDFDWGGVHSDDDILYQLGVGFYNDNVSMGSNWFPCYDHPSDKAEYKFIFKVNENLNVASNGNIDTIYVNDNYKIIEYSSENEIATYLMTFAVSDYIMLNQNYNDIPIHIYTKKEDSAASEYAYQNIDLMLECFEKYYGDYPFDKVGYVNTIKGAMEHQTMISMPVHLIKRAYQYQTPNVSTIAHELAHQWFGDYVTPLDFRHAWLTESFATFSESLYLEYTEGYDSYIYNLYSQMMNYTRFLSEKEGKFPLYDFPRETPSSNYPQTIYKKGAVVLGMLRYMTIDDFFPILNEYLETYAYGNATTEDLKNIFKEKSDIDIEKFWEQWIYGSGFPRLNITIEILDDKIKIISNQIQDEGTFTDFPLEINFQKDAKDSSFVFYINSEKDTFYVNKINYDKIEINKGPNVISLCEINNVDVISSVNNEINDVLLFPNPAEDFLFLSFENFNYDNLEIYDILGNKVIVESILYRSSPYKIDISGLNAGVYYLRIKDKNYKFIKK